MTVREAYRVVAFDDIVPHIPWCRHAKVPTPFIPIPLPICSSQKGSMLPPWYHHGTEIFYRSASMPSGDYTLCTGLPHNEDLTSRCSDELYATSKLIPTPDKIKTAISHHLVYFGIAVGSVCGN